MRKTLIRISPIAFFVATAIAHAQSSSVESPPPNVTVPEKPARQTPVLIEEIVVTARKREEQLHDVPISAQVFSAETMTHDNLINLTDIGQFDPSIAVTGTLGRSGALVIRGVGSGDGTSFDPSVGNFVDGINHPRTQYLLQNLFDTDRVEILRGSQSTFFGIDTISGAVSTTTARPTDESSAYVRASGGSFGQYNAEGMVNIPLTDQWQIRGAVLADGEDGWLDNVGTHEKFPHNNDIAARLSARFNNRDWEGILKIEGGSVKRGGGLFLTVADCPPPAPFTAMGFCSGVDQGVPMGLGNKTSEVPGQVVQLSTQEDVLTLHYHQWGQTFTSITGYSEYHYQQDLDVAGTPVNTINVATPEHYSQASQEFQVASDLGAPIDYLAGVYAQTDKLVNDTNLVYFILNAAIPAADQPLGQDTNYRQYNRIYSAFASGTWHVTDALSLTAGVRGTQELKSFDWHLFYGQAQTPFGRQVVAVPGLSALPMAIGLGTQGTVMGSRDDHAVTPSAQAQYKLTEHSMVYGSYSDGFKGGGFNAGDHSAIPGNLPFGPEHVHGFELGSKNMWANLRIDTDVFYSRYRDLQVSTNLPGPNGAFLNVVANAAEVESRGVELITQYSLLNSNLQLGLDATYLESTYLSYPHAPPSPLQQLQGFGDVSLTGTSTTSAPRWSGTANATYKTALPRDYRFESALYLIGSSDYFQDILNRNTGEYFRLDSRFSLLAADWSIDVIAHNITDRNINTFLSPQPNAPGTVLQQKQAPRGVVLQLTRKW